MGIARTVAKNSLMIMLSKIVVRLLSLLFVIFVARYLGANGFGKYSFVFAFLSFFTVFIGFGIDTLLIREVSKQKDKSSIFIINSVALKSIFSLISWMIIILLVLFLKKDFQTSAGLLIIGFCLFLDSIVSSFKSVFIAYEKMEFNTLIEISIKAIIVGLGLLAIYLNYGLIAIFSASLVASIWSLSLSYYIYSKRISSLKARFDSNLCKFILKTSYPFALAGIFVAMLYRTDTVMLSFIKGDSAVGWYSAAYGLSESLLFIPTIICSAVFPVLSRLFKESKATFNKIYETSFKFLLILGLPIACGVTLLADKIILFLYSSGFSNSIIALRILIWSIALAFLSSIMCIVLYSASKERVVFKTSGLLVLLNIILNLLFIPKYSYIAASFTTLTTELVGCLYYFFFISKFVSKIRINEILFKIFVAAIIMSTLILFTRNLNLFILVFSGAITYLIGLIILKTFSNDEIRRLKGLIFSPLKA